MQKKKMPLKLPLPVLLWSNVAIAVSKAAIDLQEGSHVIGKVTMYKTIIVVTCGLCSAW